MEGMGGPGGLWRVEPGDSRDMLHLESQTKWVREWTLSPLS